MKKKVANQRKDLLHKESKKLADTYDAVCIEDLNMKGMSSCLHFGKSVHDNGWGMFCTFLEYKLNDRGKNLIKIDRNFPSSQTCSTCSAKDPITKDLSIREWTCTHCQTHHDRDINAAINIKYEGMRTVS